jgi:hypothetical protein
MVNTTGAVSGVTQAKSVRSRTYSVESDLVNLLSHIGQTLTQLRWEGRDAIGAAPPCVSRSHDSLAQQLGTKLKIEIVDGFTKALEAHGTHEFTQGGG